MPRTRVVTIDGTEYKLASLNCEQVEDMIDAQEAAKLDGDKIDHKALRLQSWLAIINSLNNASPTTPYTLGELRKVVDLDGYGQLHETALEVSGLRKGEALAPAKKEEIMNPSTSTSSEAASSPN